MTKQRSPIPHGQYEARIVRSRFRAAATGNRLDLDFVEVRK